LFRIKKGFTFAIRKTGKIFKDLLSKKKIKKYFNFYLQIKKEVVLLHPLTERIAIKYEEHVPRHIELTAVLMETLKQIKRE